MEFCRGKNSRLGSGEVVSDEWFGVAGVVTREVLLFRGVSLLVVR